MKWTLWDVLEIVLTFVILFILILIITFFMILFDRTYEEAAINTILVLIAVKYSEKLINKLNGSEKRR